MEYNYDTTQDTWKQFNKYTHLHKLITTQLRGKSKRLNIKFILSKTHQLSPLGLQALLNTINNQ